MIPIPVMGTAIVNGVHWIDRLLTSIDYPIDNFIIINNNGRDQISSELENIKLKYLKNDLIKKLHICTMPSNIGCSAAWNLIIKSMIIHPYWIIVNHDIAFTPNFLKTMIEKANNPVTGIVFGRSQGDNLGMWDLFLIKDWVINTWGFFDENCYPAYCEDLDYAMRIRNFYDIQDYVNLPYFHGETLDYAQSGSQTWRNDLSIKEKIDYGRYVNENIYLTNKWGNKWRWLDVPKYPYNKNNVLLEDSGYYKYDINFIRSKYIGF